MTTRRWPTPTDASCSWSIPLLALSLFIGIYPKPVLDRVEPTVKCVLSNFEQHAKFELPALDQLKTGDRKGCR